MGLLGLQECRSVSACVCPSMTVALVGAEVFEPVPVLDLRSGTLCVVNPSINPSTVALTHIVLFSGERERAHFWGFGGGRERKYVELC